MSDEGIHITTITITTTHPHHHHHHYPLSPSPLPTLTITITTTHSHHHHYTHSHHHHHQPSPSPLPTLTITTTTIHPHPHHPSLTQTGLSSGWSTTKLQTFFMKRNKMLRLSRLSGILVLSIGKKTMSVLKLRCLKASRNITHTNADIWRTSN